MKGFIISTLFVVQAFAQLAVAGDDPAGPIREGDVRAMLSAQGLDSSTIDQVISALQSSADGGQEIELDGALSSQGVNGAFLVDNDNWNLDATIRVNGELVRVPSLYDVYYHNGGLTISASYKMFWVFVPNWVGVRNLDGATFGGPIFGRGIALHTSLVAGNPIVVEGGWVNNPQLGNVFIMAVKFEPLNLLAGATPAGAASVKAASTLTFPRMTFSQKRLLPQ